ncbi:MAG: HAD family hydrolase [Oscillospiraceae bacterium]
MINGAVFDMDGLMFDTEAVSTRCWQEAGRRIGVDIPPSLSLRTNGLDAEHCRPIFEEAFGKSFDYYAARALRQELEREYVESFGVPLKAGLFELLDFLRSENVAMAVASSSSEEKVTHYLKLTGTDKYFRTVINGGMVKRGKPDPEIFLTACAALGIPPRECIALEDSPAGIRSAASAGLLAVMIPDLVPPTEKENRLAFAILPSLIDVIGLVKSLTACR